MMKFIAIINWIIGLFKDLDGINQRLKGQFFVEWDCEIKKEENQNLYHFTFKTKIVNHKASTVRLKPVQLNLRKRSNSNMDDIVITVDVPNRQYQDLVLNGEERKEIIFSYSFPLDPETILKHDPRWFDEYRFSTGLTTNEAFDIISSWEKPDK
ncbi:MAG: hypothetical protein LPK28_00110, partial [Bacteroidota bacterium]|nr:hypothetical protein [Bacteroidota bacterium]